MLGAGYRAIPLRPGDPHAPLQLCLIVQDKGDQVSGTFVLLRNLADAAVYLGCIADAGGAVREWIEVWVQNLENFAAAFPAYHLTAANSILDANWTARAEAFRLIEPESTIATGWESSPPPPLFFDRDLDAPVAVTDEESHSPWELCRDDAFLKSKGLPEYSRSLARYLWVPAKGAAARLVPAISGSPENDSTTPLAEVVRDLIPLNPSGGLMMVRTFAPLSYEEFVGVVSGTPWPGVEHGWKVFKPKGVYSTLQDASVIRFGGGHLFLGHHGRAGLMAESFHLKLHLLAAALRLVRSHVKAHQVPFLNLNASSFRVSLSDSDSALPFLWNFKLSLAMAGEALALPLKSTDARYFVPARFGETSVYRPQITSLPVSGTGSVRIRKVRPGGGDEVSLEGTLVTTERLATAGSDLLWLRLALPSGRVDLYARMKAGESAAAEELRFQTLPQRLGAETVASLNQSLGVPLSNVLFETLPLLTTPCDLYSLGVLGVRTLLVGEELSLPIALDEMLSLARKAAPEDESAPSIARRVSAIAAADPERAATLGPHRLLREPGPMPPFPESLWWEAIALLLRFFPGCGPDSFCRDLGDAPPLALEQIFDEPLMELEKLLLRSRSVLFSDWAANREIGALIRKSLVRHGGQPRP